MEGSFWRSRNGSPFVQPVPDTMLTFCPATCASAGAAANANQASTRTTRTFMFRVVNSPLLRRAKAERVRLGDARMTTSDSFYEGHLRDRGQKITEYLLERFHAPANSAGRKRNVRPVRGGKSPPVLLFRQVLHFSDTSHCAASPI